MHYYLFSPLKCHIRNRNFNSREESMAVINAWLDSKPGDFFKNGISMLPQRWQKCIKNGGNYFEHLSDYDE